MPQPIYTIGHSTHSHQHFLWLLRQVGINCLVDVRSIAASGYNPQYNKAALKCFLNDNGIQYLHFSTEFGARRAEPGMLDERGKVYVERVVTSATFLAGVERLRKGMDRGYAIALMCAEADPLQCHRFHMISGYIVREGFDVLHILKEGSVLPHALVQLQVHKNDIRKQQPDIFSTHL